MWKSIQFWRDEIESIIICSIVSIITASILIEYINKINDKQREYTYIMTKNYNRNNIKNKKSNKEKLG